MKVNLDEVTAPMGVGAKKIIDQVRDDSHDPDKLEARVLLLALAEAFDHGDGDFAELLLRFTGRALATDSLTATHKLFLLRLIYQMLDKGSFQAAVGVKPRGRPRRGGKGYFAAVSVFLAIEKYGATSIEDAQQAVADSQHMSFSAVKQHWERWGSVVLRMWQKKVPDIELHLKERMAENKAALSKMTFKLSDKKGA